MSFITIQYQQMTQKVETDTLILRSGKGKQKIGLWKTSTDRICYIDIPEGRELLVIYDNAKCNNLRTITDVWSNGIINSANVGGNIICSGMASVIKAQQTINQMGMRVSIPNIIRTNSEILVINGMLKKLEFIKPKWLNSYMIINGEVDKLTSPFRLYHRGNINDAFTRCNMILT